MTHHRCNTQETNVCVIVMNINDIDLACIRDEPLLTFHSLRFAPCHQGGKIYYSFLNCIAFCFLASTGGPRIAVLS